MKCPNCNSPVTKDELYCHICGRKINPRLKKTVVISSMLIFFVMVVGVLIAFLAYVYDKDESSNDIFNNGLVEPNDSNRDDNSQFSPSVSNSEDEITVRFLSMGDDVGQPQVIIRGNTISQPDDPVREGYTFVGWSMEDGALFNFEDVIYEDIDLSAEWAKIVDIEEEELAKLLFVESQGNEIDNQISLELQCEGIKDVVVEYEPNDKGEVSIEQVISGPLLTISGLVGAPVNISAVGGNISTATITFHYDPSKLSGTSPDDLAVVWYNSDKNVVECKCQ